MTLGDKIRKFRNLNKLTQKELGQRVGFSAATADSRIRKYENDVMAPKAEIREKIAEQLDVNISALSDISINSFEDIMQILFYLEEEFDMKIETNNGKINLTFDTNNHDIYKIEELNTYLYAWANKKKSVLPNDRDADIEYKKWKGRFPKDLLQYLSAQIVLLDNKYDALVSSIKKETPPVKKASELFLLIRTLIESGLDLVIYDVEFMPGDSGLALSFLLSELLDDSNHERQLLFSKYLSQLETLKKYGMNIFREPHLCEKGTLVTYTLRYPYLTSWTKDLIALQEFRRNKSSYTDYDINLFEERLSEALRIYDMDLSDIDYDNSYSKRVKIVDIL